MQPAGYSPYTAKPKIESRLKLKLPKLSGGTKKWLTIIIGILLGVFIVFYLLLGDLRFFANNYLRLTWFNKNYVILLQNNYESRPGGGFITAYGNLDITLGIPRNFSFNNSYEIDTDTYVTPPYPHEDMLKNEWYEGYTFRDANWSANFPDSVPQLIEFYQNKFPNKDVDGIIVVNFTLIEDLVERLGGIEVDGKVLTKDTLFSAITNTVNDVDRHNEEALNERKDILSDLSSILIKKAKWHPFKSKAAIIKALNNKDLYMWVDSIGMEKKLMKKGWANAFELPEASDFLAVNIANLGSKKADRYLLKEVHHYVNITKELPEITTEIVVRYPGFKNNFADDYKGYLQLVIPASANIVNNIMESTVTDIGDFKIIGEKLILPAGGKTTLTYTYTLPRNLLNPNEYKLKLIKQSGDEKYIWVTVETAPDRIISSDTFEVKENRAYFYEKLQNDKDLSLNLLEDTDSPYPIEQVFENLKTISIYWNEPIDESVANDATNYKITDLNVTDGGTTDEVEVIYAEVIDASVSRLEVSGITEQNLERYQIELKNIRDTSGNTINPNPKEITVIQRISEKKAVEEVPIPTEATSQPFVIEDVSEL
ncbi:DUF4012 domain-containing protein [Candidatus Peregrinibacteria bacterium]|nr:DUF4012 domain-containing protein [Candidatus Peregrinibacteria bacterium]